jgi:hypothetical protein
VTPAEHLRAPQRYGCTFQCRTSLDRTISTTAAPDSSDCRRRPPMPAFLGPAPLLGLPLALPPAPPPEPVGAVLPALQLQLAPAEAEAELAEHSLAGPAGTRLSLERREGGSSPRCALSAKLVPGGSSSPLEQMEGGAELG